MQNLNIDMLKDNIRNLMQENRVTQETLSSAIGMTQPNFSRAISPEKKQCFTLEQVFKIAQFFDISVDSLVGNEKPVTTESEKDICSLLTALLEKRKLIRVEHKRVEEIATPVAIDGYPDVFVEKKEYVYDAFIFPRCTDVGPLDRFTEDQIDDLQMDYNCGGNIDESNTRINEYFQKFFNIYDLYLHNHISEEMLHEITEKFMSDLK